jgi:hypothetical protein
VLALYILLRARSAAWTMMENILVPALALVCWTLVMWIWLYATRIPAMNAAGLRASKVKEKRELDVLPRKVRQVAENYNHLHEQPVIFYALLFYSHLVGVADPLNIALAWTYVGFRVAHSLVQALVNFIPLRFGLFALGTLALFGIAGRNVIAALG